MYSPGTRESNKSSEGKNRTKRKGRGEDQEGFTGPAGLPASLGPHRVFPGPPLQLT
jgi:hypothetical protein